MQTIAGSSSHLLHVINEILDLSKIDAGRMDVARAEFDLTALVQEIAVMFQPLCEEKRLGLRIEGLGAGDAIPVVGDAAKLRQVLINLLGNAVKFTEDGLIIVRGCSIERRAVAVRGGRHRARASPTRSVTRVFEPFQQGCGAARRAAPGSGWRSPAARSS